ncbi:MAG: endonuclease/exonuclease/phosphatase family protein, partial [Anaerolineae bacterium]|nr:endonuclease/exonuclease/phosphatase family protein [Anaerolineae bacterium]
RNRFGEVVVLADEGAGAGLRTGRGGIVVRPTDYNPERLFLDDELLLGQGGKMPVVNVGDRLPGPLVGPLDYSFGNFKIQLTSEPAVSPANLPRGVAQPPTPDQLSVASFNVENLDPTDVGRFEALAAAIVGNLRSPDLISVEEIQDNNGPFNDTVVDASRTYSRLVEAIRAAGGPTYTVRQIDPVDDQDGGEPGGNIRVGFLFRTDRGLAFVDRHGGTSTTAVGLENGPGGLHLTVSPGRLEPTHPAFQNSRKPLVGEFQVGGQTLFVIGAHLISKGGDHPLMGRFQPPVLSSEPARVQQAQVLAQFVQRLLAADADANILLLGDLNDFPFSAPLQTLKAAGLQVLAETLPEGEQYSYVFEGNSQVLDHILVSAPLAHMAAPQFEFIHLNAEYAERLSDHDPTLVRLTLPHAAAQPLPTLPPLPIIPWTQARQYLGQTVRAEGTIVTTRNTGRVTYLNFSRNFQTDLKIVIFPAEAARFPQPPELMFDGRTVRVTGKVEEYQGAPEIIVRDPQQIEVLK